jgi:hypothetical protein
MVADVDDNNKKTRGIDVENEKHLAVGEVLIKFTLFCYIGYVR